jgi:hypothetical protein
MLEIQYHLIIYFMNLYTKNVYNLTLMVKGYQVQHFRFTYTSNWWTKGVVYKHYSNMLAWTNFETEVNVPPKRISLPELIPQKQFSQTSESTSTMKKCI